MNFPTLETNRLLLRTLTPEDRFAIFRNYSDPDVANWFFEKPLTQIEEAEQIIAAFLKSAEDGKGHTWAIVLKEGRELIGTCGYENFVVDARGEVGFDLAKAYWGKGTMTEALGAIIRYGFDVLRLSEICAHTYSNNSRARRVLEKLGFRGDAVNADSHSYVLSHPDWVERCNHAGV
jgi:[ribosomal protein S5]-alanine N-acetyltransferase